MFITECSDGQERSQRQLPVMLLCWAPRVSVDLKGIYGGSTEFKRMQLYLLSCFNWAWLSSSTSRLLSWCQA
ncbi:hypothetical protein IMY05_014G0021900 [Salix suchowensis]|nr:hypothetical protein IMY05_014G0021900 [Salix suchowensis]